MASTWLSLALLVLIIAMVPLALKWLQARTGLGRLPAQGGIRVLDAAAVGPQQRVMTVEIGAPGARTRLTLGVTPTHITCLHQTAVDAPALERIQADAFDHAP